MTFQSRISAIGIFAFGALYGSAAQAQSIDSEILDLIEDDPTEAERLINAAAASVVPAPPPPLQDNFCFIFVNEDGTLQASPDRFELTSKSYGARSGQVYIWSFSSRYRLSLDQPLGFTIAPPGGTTNVSFAASYSGTGATNFTDRPGSQFTRMRRGITRVDVDLTATRLNDPFPGGDYESYVTVRCE